MVSGDPISPLRSAAFALSVSRQDWYSFHRSPLPGASIPLRPYYDSAKRKKVQPDASSIASSSVGAHMKPLTMAIFGLVL